MAHRVLLQGFERGCPVCGLRRWYPIDRLSDAPTCDGCQQTSRLPIAPDALSWRYHLNEVVAQAVTQGVLSTSWR